MSEYTLYCFAQSGNAYKAALTLELAGADWTPRFVGIHVLALGESIGVEEGSPTDELVLTRERIVRLGERIVTELARHGRAGVVREIALICE